MAKNTPAKGTAPFAHLLGRVLGKSSGGKADEGDLAPDDDAVVDQEEVDDALDDKEVEDIEDGDKPDAKGKKAKGKKAKAEDDADGDDAKAEDADDDKEAKAFQRGSAAQLKRCLTIFDSAAATGRPDAAAYFAFKTNLSAAAAIGAMQATTGMPASGLGDRMAGRTDPNPGADGGRAGTTFADKHAAAKTQAGTA